MALARSDQAIDLAFLILRLTAATSRASDKKVEDCYNPVTVFGDEL
jgi:hypothetical protein